MVSRKWTCQLSSGVHIAHGGRDAALGHHRVRLAEQRLADHGRTGAALARLDGGAQARAPGADHDDVPLLPVDHGHQKNLGSSKAPDATRYT